MPHDGEASPMPRRACRSLAEGERQACSASGGRGSHRHRPAFSLAPRGAAGRARLVRGATYHPDRLRFLDRTCPIFAAVARSGAGAGPGPARPEPGLDADRGRAEYALRRHLHLHLRRPSPARSCPSMPPATALPPASGRSSDAPPGPSVPPAADTPQRRRPMPSPPLRPRPPLVGQSPPPGSAAGRLHRPLRRSPDRRQRAALFEETPGNAAGTLMQGAVV